MLSWISVDARTGNILAEFPDIQPQGLVAVTMGRYETLGFVLPYPASVVSYAYALKEGGTLDPNALTDFSDFNGATTPGAAVLIALDESTNPIWGGLILTRSKDHTGAVTLATATMEAYFDRRFTGAYQVIGYDQNQIVADLVTSFAKDGVLPGIPIRIANSASAQPGQSVTFNNYDDKTVYANLGSLSGILNGPQWTVGWEWQSGPQRVTPVLYVSDRLGRAVPATLAAPNALFSMPGCVSSFTYDEDWSTGKGANRVTATGSGQGLTRVSDTEDALNFKGRPMFELRYAPPQPSLSAGVAASTLTVHQHASAALAFLQVGARVLTMTAAIQDAPVLGLDWFLGDDVGYDLMAPGFIDGSLSAGVGRCIGWQRDDTTVTPVLFTQDPNNL